ncbi:hypothetical protein [Pseudolysinimonas sp.]|uniref:hypothetical protein n=1 Tax=Pseudolysinimonas sp. TaxID=2680009 RepID=UPI00286D201E|nr:hypothetical protein [Pseudolysinimonas sp.]
MPQRHLLTSTLAAFSLLALAACTVPGSGDDGTDTSTDGSSGASGDVASCLEGNWSLDTADLAGQLQAYFVENGTPVTSTTQDGAVTLDVDADTMTFESGVTFTMTAVTEGLTMVIAQDQAGISTGAWTVEGDDVVFSDWDNGITITNTITIGGESVGDSMELPADTGAGVPMTVNCDGDTLTTKPDESPFTSRWSRIG